MSTMTRLFATTAICATLSACYVMPVNPQSSYQYGAYANPNAGVAIVPAAAIRPPYTARLYPSNDAAARQGQVSGMITNPERGHGEFSFAMGGETFRGEATRAPNSSKGVANAAGSRGGYVRCDYTMSNAELGSGSCQFSQGARYDMHISQ